LQKGVAEWVESCLLSKHKHCASFKQVICTSANLEEAAMVLSKRLALLFIKKGRGTMLTARTEKRKCEHCGGSGKCSCATCATIRKNHPEFTARCGVGYCADCFGSGQPRASASRSR